MLHSRGTLLKQRSLSSIAYGVPCCRTQRIPRGSTKRVSDLSSNQFFSGPAHLRDFCPVPAHLGIILGNLRVFYCQEL